MNSNDFSNFSLKSDDFLLDAKRDSISLTGYKNKELKRTVMGGYTKRSVDKYVDDLENSIQNMKINLETQLKSLLQEKELIFQENTLLKMQMSESTEYSLKFKAEVEEQKQEIKKLEQDLALAREDIEYHKINGLSQSNLESKIQKYERDFAELRELINESNEKYINLDKIKVDLEQKLILNENRLICKEDELKKLKDKNKEQQEIFEVQIKEMRENFNSSNHLEHRITELTEIISENEETILSQREVINKNKKDYDALIFRYKNEENSLKERYETKIQDLNKITDELKNKLSLSESYDEDIMLRFADAQRKYCEIDQQKDNIIRHLEITLDQYRNKNQSNLGNPQMDSGLNVRVNRPRVRDYESDFIDFCKERLSEFENKESQNTENRGMNIDECHDERSELRKLFSYND